jgi:hypothetical protein
MARNWAYSNHRKRIAHLLDAGRLNLSAAKNAEQE